MWERDDIYTAIF